MIDHLTGWILAVTGVVVSVLGWFAYRQLSRKLHDTHEEVRETRRDVGGVRAKLEDHAEGAEYHRTRFMDRITFMGIRLDGIWRRTHQTGETADKVGKAIKAIEDAEIKKGDT